MKLTFVIALLLISSVFAPAQSAKVIALSAEDAVEAKLLSDAQVALTAKQKKFEEKIKNKYLYTFDYKKAGQQLACTVLPNSPEKCQYIKGGWGWGKFEFSEDYKYIVPIPIAPIPSTPGTSNSYISLDDERCGGFFANGAIISMDGSCPTSNQQAAGWGTFKAKIKY